MLFPILWREEVCVFDQTSAGFLQDLNISKLYSLFVKLVKAKKYKF